MYPKWFSCNPRITIAIAIGYLSLLTIGCASTPPAQQGAEALELREWQCDDTFWDCRPADAAGLAGFCDDGVARACEKLGDAYFDHPHSVDIEEGRRFLERACELGRPAACQRLANAYYADPDRGDDQARAGELLRGACDDGIAGACLDKGQLIEAGDPAEAFLRYRQGCAGGSEQACESAASLLDELGDQLFESIATACENDEPRACAELGVFYDGGTFVDEDRPAAEALFERACVADARTGCFYLGQLKLGRGIPELEEGLPATPDDAPDSISLTGEFFDGAELACLGGDGYQCQQIAQFYEIGGFREVNHEVALDLYLKGCTSGYSPACDYLLHAIEDKSELVAANPEYTYRSLLEHCHWGNADACALIGYAHLYGVDGSSDLRRAYNAFRTACVDGVSKGCTSVGVMHAVGQGVRQDYGLAHDFYGLACDADDPTGCANLGTLYMMGEGVAQDLGRASEYFEYGCDLGGTDGCNRLKIVDLAWPVRETTDSTPDQGGGADGANNPIRCSLRTLKCESVTEEKLDRDCDAEDGYSCEMLYLLMVQRGDPDVPRGLDYLERACQYGYVPACTNLGVIYLEALDRPEDAAEALSLACEGGRPLGCINLGSMYEEGLGGLSPDNTRALLLYADACRDGEGTGCHYLHQLADKAGNEIHQAMASDCEGGQVEACRQLARLTDLDVSFAPAEEEARSLYEKACEGGDPIACRWLGGLPFMEALVDVTGDEADVESERIEESLTFLTTACGAGDGQACLMMGLLFEVDSVEAMAGDDSSADRYEKACQLGSFEGCRRLAEKYLDGDGVDTDPDRAISLYHESCLAHDLESCFQLGTLYLQGRGVEPNIDHTEAAFTTSCIRGHNEACLQLGYLKADGEEMEQDFDWAYQFFSIACNYDHLRACTELGTLYFFGQGTEMNHQYTVQYLNHACQSGDDEGCRRLQALRALGGQ